MPAYIIIFGKRTQRLRVPSSIALDCTRRKQASKMVRIDRQHVTPQKKQIIIINLIRHFLSPAGSLTSMHAYSPRSFGSARSRWKRNMQVRDSLLRFLTPWSSENLFWCVSPRRQSGPAPESCVTLATRPSVIMGSLRDHHLQESRVDLVDLDTR